MNENNKEHFEEQEKQDIENQNIAEELESVNEARVNSKGEHEDQKDQSDEQLEKLQQQLEEANNKYLRLYAEFDNYKRRTSKERVELLQTAGKEVIADLIPVLDDFDRANKAIEGATDLEPIKEGVELVHHKLKSMLTRKGLKVMETIGLEFDPELHEAITRIPSPTPDQVGKVIDEVEKGYFLNEKVLRYAKVVVGS